mgnify:CR=1 FL=1
MLSVNFFLYNDLYKNRIHALIFEPFFQFGTVLAYV